MERLLRIEGIPPIASSFYSWLARKNPVLRDLYKEVAEEVCSNVVSGRILDIGTGPGYLPIEIAKRSPNIEIIGIDISPSMVKIASGNSKQMGFSHRVRFVFGDVAKIPFESEHFDFVVSTASLHHWSKPIASIREIYRVLKENKEAWIYDLQKEIPGEIAMQFRKKYGWFMALIYLQGVARHGVTHHEAQAILTSPDTLFSGKFLEEKGTALKLRLVK